jgi:predicted O-methyltransferase YrrM
MNDRVAASLAPTYRVLRRVRRRVRLVRWSAYNRRELARLRANNDLRSRQLADALTAAIGDAMRDEELEAIARIERSRATLERSPLPLRRSPRTFPRRPEGKRWPSTITVGRAARYASVHEAWGRLLFALVRAASPAYVLELGTAIGISGAYISTALALDGRGRLVTMEANSDLAAQAGWLFDHLGLLNVEQRVEWITAESLAEVCRSYGPIDFAYVDAIKDGDVLLDMHRHLSEQASSDAIIIYDDIDWSGEMIAVWAAIQNEPSVATSIDLGRMGIVVVNRPRPEHSRVSLHIY